MNGRIDAGSALALLGLLLASCGQEDKITTPVENPPDPIDFTARPVLTGLDRPVLVTAPPHTAGIWIVLKPGKIIFQDADSSVSTFLDITDRVSPPDPITGFSGLGSMAFHPRYATNGSFFVVYVDNVDFDVRVSRFQARSGNAHEADPASEEIFLAWDRPMTAIHDICHLEFEPSTGYLFVSLGDGTEGSVAGSQLARDLGSLAGKMLRLDVDRSDATRGTRYSIPPGNPFVDVPGARPEIWAKGLRNPWRFSFDHVTGDLYIADPGQATWEEINIEPPSTPGRDYGWSLLEGSHCSPLNRVCNAESLMSALELTPPEHEYFHDIQTGRGCKAAIIGGYVYRGQAIPDLWGEYLFADYCVEGYVRSLRYSDGWITRSRSLRERLMLGPGINVSSLGRDGFGELYIVAWYGGTVLKIVPIDEAIDPLGEGM